MTVGHAAFAKAEPAFQGLTPAHCLPVSPNTPTLDPLFIKINHCGHHFLGSWQLILTSDWDFSWAFSGS